MAHGKHVAKKGNRRLWPAVLLVAVILLVASFGGVVAYLSTSAGPVTNDFTKQTDGNPALSNYAVTIDKDLGYSVYVRAIPVINWKDANGNVLGEAPLAGGDYTITMNATDWFEQGGFWYYTKPVNPGGATTALISAIKVNAAPEGYSLTVDMAAQIIQALGSTDVSGEPYTDGIPAVQDAWGVAVAGTGN